VPIGAWLRGPLRAALTDLLAEETIARRGLFRAREVGRWVDEHLSGVADHGEALWLLMALEGFAHAALDRSAP